MDNTPSFMNIPYPAPGEKEFAFWLSIKDLYNAPLGESNNKEFNTFKHNVSYEDSKN